MALARAGWNHSPEAGAPVREKGVIAMIAGGEDTRRGPLPLAFAHAGFEPCELLDTDEADRLLAARGPGSCVLVLDVGSLDPGAGSAGWTRYLARHRDVPAVVVARGGVDVEVRAVASGEPHRVLVDSPFDPAAVVAAARQAASARRPLRRRPAEPLRDAG
jgi:hypothetical protein